MINLLHKKLGRTLAQTHDKQHTQNLARTNLLGQFIEEQLREARDSLVAVNDTDGHLADLTFHLDHVVQDKVSQYLHRVLTHF